METRKTIGIIGIAVGLALCGAAKSDAVVRYDVSGTWTGKGTCHGFDPTLPKNGKLTLSTSMTFQIQDVGGDTLNVSGGDPFAGGYSGHLLRSSNALDRPQAALLSCGTTVGSLSAHFFDAQFTIKSDVKGTDKSSMRATSIYTFQPGDVALCKWTFKRTSTASVAVDDCSAASATPTPTPTPAVTPTPIAGAYQMVCDCRSSSLFMVGACGADCGNTEIIAQCSSACEAAGGTYDFSIESCDQSDSCTVGPIITPTPAPTPVKYSVACSCADDQIATVCVNDDCSSATTTPACTAGCSALGSSYVAPPSSCQVDPTCGQPQK